MSNHHRTRVVWVAERGKGEPEGMTWGWGGGCVGSRAGVASYLLCLGVGHQAEHTPALPCPCRPLELASAIWKMGVE